MRGTPESQWCAFLRRAELWEPTPGPLLVVAPHPDDEILGTGGLIRAWSHLGWPVTVVSVTDGEAADASRTDLHIIRQNELRIALRRLSSLHVPVERLGIPDGRVSEHRNRVRDAVRQYVQPGVTLLAPFEHDGHPDHETVGRVCLELASTEHVSIARYPIWAWHHTAPTALTKLRWGRFPLTLDLQCAKSRAVQCFESQLRPPSGLPIIPPHVLPYFERTFEAFIL